MTTVLSHPLRSLIVGAFLVTATLLMLMPLAAQAATANIDDAVLTTVATKPTLSGTATGTASIRLVVTDVNGKSVFKKTARVRSGLWAVRVTKKLKNGTYEVRVLDTSRRDAKVLDVEALSIGEPQSLLPRSSGTLSVGALPLLTGGTAAPGVSVPVAYLRVQNASSDTVTLEGIEFVQEGNASAASVIGFATNDDKGGSRTVVGGLETTPQFKNGAAYLPFIAAVEPGQVRIFTVKAILSSNHGTDLGKQLFLSVRNVRANGAVRAAYPIRGTTWTLVR